MATVNLDLMDLSHLEQVLAIEQETFPSAWTLGLFVTELANPWADWFVALEGDTLVGYAGIQQVADVGHVLNIAVREGRRDRGTGSTLMRRLFEAARARKIVSVTLEVRSQNLAAQRFYHRFGFEAAGSRKAYYADSGEDAVIMLTDVGRSAELAEPIPGATAAGSKGAP